MSKAKLVLVIIALVLAIVGVSTALLILTQPQPVSANQPVAECPAGAYLIGYKDDTNTQPVCKLEPTGCPYGDSLPLGPDCDKHAPQPDPAQKPSETITTPETVKPDVWGGK